MGCPNASVRLSSSEFLSRLGFGTSGQGAVGTGGANRRGARHRRRLFGVPVLVLAASWLRSWPRGAGRAAVCVSVLRWSRSVMRLSVACLTSSAVSGASAAAPGYRGPPGRLVSVLQPATRQSRRAGKRQAREQPASSRLNDRPRCPRYALASFWVARRTPHSVTRCRQEIPTASIVYKNILEQHTSHRITAYIWSKQSLGGRQRMAQPAIGSDRAAHRNRALPCVGDLQRAMSAAKGRGERSFAAFEETSCGLHRKNR